MAAFFGTKSVEDGIECQSKTEALIVKHLLARGYRPSRPKGIRTEHGLYTPDFEFEDFYIEVKSPGTWRVCCGDEAFFEDSRDARLSTPSNKQLLKIQWVDANVKPVVVVVLRKASKCDKQLAKLVGNLEIVDIDHFLLARPAVSLYNIINQRLERRNEVGRHHEV